MKTRRIAYWIATALTAFVFVAGGAADIARPAAVMEGMEEIVRGSAAHTWPRVHRPRQGLCARAGQHAGLERHCNGDRLPG